MPPLRWLLLGLGLLFIAGLAWRELRRGRQDAAGGDSRTRRTEPSFDPLPDVPAQHEEVAPRDLPIVDWPVANASDDESGQVDAAAEPATPAGPPLEAIATRPASTAPPRPSIAEWPPEEQRRICSLRLLPRRQERFSGRSLRQGLLSVGFQHGDLGIFHIAGSEGHAMISVANLARPGQLDPGMMDFQRFAGLHLFTVLPGRLPAKPALQQLFAVAQDLAGRLDGSVRDDTGGPLDAARMAALVQQFADEQPASSAGH